MLAVAIITFFSVYREGIRDLEEAKLDDVVMTESFADVIWSETKFKDMDKLTSLINAFLSTEKVLAVSIYDKNGHVIKQANKDIANNNVLKNVSGIQKTIVESSDHQINVIYPIRMLDKNLAGYLCASYSNTDLKNHKYQQLTDLFLAVIFCFFFSLFTTSIFSSWIIGPLRELTDKANRIIQGESIPLTLSRQDEIGSLALSLNTMLRYINNRDEKLREFASSLEQKVEQRTEELELALNKAEAATEAKAAFLASMTHELRTPMNGVIGTASLMEDSELTQQQRDQLNIILNCGKHLLTVINDILDYSKIEASKMELEYSPLSLNKLLTEALNIVRPMIDDKDLTIDCAVEENVHPYFEGDAVRLRQILVNLISNAIKFTAVGGIEVNVKSLSNNRLEFSVRDTGIGISSEAQKKLFKAFTQADSSTTRKYGGTGLGLVICKKLVELMGGKISVRSKQGQGSTFTFSIQAKPVSELPAEVAYRSDAQQDELSSIKPMKILLAEDNAVNQMVAKGFLQKLGYKADVANNGQEVIQAIQQKDYDLIFMDMMMPEMDGLEATRIICSLYPPQQRPWIIAMTANALEEHKQQCLQAGMNDFLTKPFTVSSLEACLLAAPCVIRKAIAESNQIPKKPKTQKKTIRGKKYKYINKDKIFEGFRGDEDLVPIAIEGFIKDYPLQLARIATGIQNDNADEVAIAAHTLKGTVSNFYAKNAVELAINVEKCVRQNNFKLANQNYEALKKELENVRTELNQLISEV